MNRIVAPGDRAAPLVGMALFLGSWALMFAALLFSYGVLRTGASSWPPPAQPGLPLFVPGLASLLLLAGSALVHRRRALLAAVAGAAFLAAQTVVWFDLHAAGLTLDGGRYAATYYALTGFHALHVLVGVVALAWLGLRRRQGEASLRSWAWYWHFIAAMWLLLFLLVHVA